MTSNEPSSDRSNRSGRIENSVVVDTEAEVISEHRETNPPKVRRVLFESSRDTVPDLSTQEHEILPFQLNVSESPSESNIMSENLPVSSDLSFSDSNRDEGCSVSEPCKEQPE